MAEFNVHRVVKIELSDVREHNTFSSRTIFITDEKGEVHEVILFSNSEDENALRVLA